jgi:hypothetical protein
VGSAARGDSQEHARVEILPTPNLRSLDNLALDPRAAGILPVGMVRLTEVTMSLTNDQLRGWAVPNLANATTPGAPIDHVPQPFDFFYEVQADDRSGGPEVRRRFRPATDPFLDAENVQWTITLERVSEDANRDGTSSYGEGTQG